MTPARSQDHSPYFSEAKRTKGGGRDRSIQMMYDIDEGFTEITGRGCVCVRILDFLLDGTETEME